MPLSPTFLSPARPSEVLSWVVAHQTYPTTLVICMPRADFLAYLVKDVSGRDDAADAVECDAVSPAARLLSAPLVQVAVARHIDMVFVPSVSHLRAFLAVFSPQDSKVAAPPVPAAAACGEVGERTTQPLLMVYGFLDLHRDTSEWSAQGLGATAAGLVEAARRVSFQPVIVESARAANIASDFRGDGGEEEGGSSMAGSILAETMPVLSRNARRMRPDMEHGGGWTGRTVKVWLVLARWFRFREGDWSKGGEKTEMSMVED